MRSSPHALSPITLAVHLRLTRTMQASIATSRDIESPYAWARLCASLLLMTIGGSGTYTISVVLPSGASRLAFPVAVK